MPQLAIGLAIVAAIGLSTGGCGSSGDDGLAGEHPDYARALAGSPAPLAALHRQANELLPGGAEAYERRIESLAGYPIVVNLWASWCGPCRLEFPTFQRVSAAYGKRVAFLGVNSQDSEERASTFLDEAPVPYPSYSDPDEAIANELRPFGLPATAFYDRDGELVYVDQKPYFEVGELQADIEHYALGGGRESG